MPTKLTFSTEAARKSYQTGLAQVANKLAGRRKPTTAEREARTLAEGKRILAAKLSPESFRKAFGHLPPAKPMAPPATAPDRKTYAQPTPEQPQRKLHRFAMARSLFG